MTVILIKRQVAERVGWHPEHLMREARAGRFSGAAPSTTLAVIHACLYGLRT